jgi:hypothetical protein
MKPPDGAEPRILLHAPTAGALVRARSNVANLARNAPDITVRIVVNAEAVAVLLDAPDVLADTLTHDSPNTLAKIGREAPAPLTVLPEGAVLAIARMQSEGGVMSAPEWRLALLVAATSFAASALAEQASVAQGQQIAAQGTAQGVAACIGCHGAQGEGNAAFPRLGGTGGRPTCRRSSMPLPTVAARAPSCNPSRRNFRPWSAPRWRCTTAS